MNRRSFMAALAGLPFVGKLIPQSLKVPPEGLDVPPELQPRQKIPECVVQPGSAYRFHDWRSGGVVYRRHLGFEEIEFFRCKRCHHELRVSPSHRVEMPRAYWISGQEDRPIAVPVLKRRRA